MEFSSKVRYAREYLNLSQEELARALNVSFTTINRWENNKTTPNKMAQGVFDAFCKEHNVILKESEGNE